MTGRQSYESLELEVQSLRALRAKLVRLLEQSEELVHAPHVSARWLRDQRQDRGWSRTDLASFIDVTGSCVKSWETARTHISKRRKQQLVALFDAHPTEESNDGNGHIGRCVCTLCSRCSVAWRIRFTTGTKQSTHPEASSITLDDALPPTS